MINYPHQQLFGLPFFNGSVETAVTTIFSAVEKREGVVTVATPNPEQIVQARHDEQFSEDLTQFDLFLPDGVGIVWASRKMGSTLDGRVAGVDVVGELLKIAREQGIRVMVVGGKGYGRVKFQVLSSKFQMINTEERRTENGELRTKGEDTVVYWVEGYEQIGKLAQSELQQADQKVLQELQAIKPEIVFVALGAPHQEAWVVRNRAALEKSGVKVAMVVGGAFDFLTGKVSRAPKLVQQVHLEWFYRLLQEPWRWRRQMRLVRFMGMVMRGE